MALPNAKKRKIFDGRYEVIEIVGRGSDSVVYHAKHIGASTQEVALKVLVNHKGKSSLTARLRKEALTLVSCRHKYVVRLDDFHSVEDLCYLSMEYAPLGDLRKFSAAGGLNIEKATRFLHQVLEALDFVHATGVIHRDMKPDNVLVTSNSEIRLADFGLALLPGDDVSLDDLKSGVGSFPYLPPESLEGVRYDTRSDLYALGLCFYELLSGSHPFEGLPIAEQLDKRRDGSLVTLHERNPSIPSNLSAVISTLMRFDPETRFQSALEAIKALGNPDFNGKIVEHRMVANAAPIDATPAAVRTESPTRPEAIAANSDKPMASPPSESANVIHSVAHQVRDPAPVNEDEIQPHDGTPPPVVAEIHANPVVSEPAVDQPPAPATPQEPYQGERIPQPTERIDLDRIKELVARDQQKKGEVAARKNQLDQERAVAEAIRDVKEARKRSETESTRTAAYSLKRKETSGQTIGNSALTRFRALPPVFRPAVVGFLATVLTVATVAGYQFFFSSRDSTPHTAAVSTQDEPQLNEPQPPKEETQERSQSPEPFAFPHIPEGTYVGQLDDLIPGVRAPITLISKPAQRQLVVIFGIAGWAPLMVSTKQEANTPSSTLAIRSNGIILYVTGELTSDTISGTFSNAVTGESGIWKVSKLSS